MREGGDTLFFKFRAEILKVFGGLVLVESVFSADKRVPAGTLSPLFIFCTIVNCSSRFLT